MNALEHFGPATRRFVEGAFAQPTRVQLEGWPVIARGEHALLFAPTGSGKTLAAFLTCIDRLTRDLDGGDPIRGAGAPPANEMSRPQAGRLRPPMAGDRIRGGDPIRGAGVPGDPVTGAGAPGDPIRGAGVPPANEMSRPQAGRLRHSAGSAGVRVLYVSPLKALVYDVEKNLRGPLIGVARAAEALQEPLRNVRVDVRTGDTPSRERVKQLRDPADILVTTPESLFLMLTSNAREVLKNVETVIVDEIHAVAGSKRGVHLALTLERLSHLVTTQGDARADYQRIGLSATQRPLDAIARYLGGDRPVTIVDASAPPRLQLTIEVPGDAPIIDDVRAPPPAKKRRSGPLITVATEEDRRGDPSPGSVARRRAQRGGTSNAGAPQGGGGMWPVLYPAILEKVMAHRSTIVFVNSRLLCERLAQRLNEIAGPQENGRDIAMAHHGSLSHRRRAEIEDELKSGNLKCLVATSSLELGVDMGAVDLVVLVESPGSASRGLQRVGRAGHSVGAVSSGVMMPKFKGDLLECAVVGQHMQQGKLESTRVPERCLDVLAQHVVAMVAMDPWSVPELLVTLRRASPYAELSREVLDAVLDMLAGKYPSDAFAELVPRVIWDRTEDRLTPRKGARALALLNAGTIPDRGLFGVHIASGDGPNGGPRIGELDEEMVYETRTGDAIVLGASTWRVEEIGRDRVIVTPAPGEAGRLPFWHGERPGRPVELGRAIGSFLRDVDTKLTSGGLRAVEEMLEGTPLDSNARASLASYLLEQRAVAGALPTDRAITVESFRDELGDWRTCILTPMGARVHAAWAQCIQVRLADHVEQPQVMWSDDGIALRFPDSEAPPDTSLLFPEPGDVDDLLIHALPDTSMFASRFRENAARALLLPRRGFKGRTPLWLQRKKSQDLLGVAQKHPSFPIVLETFRECLQDVFDVPALKELLAGVQSRAIRIDTVETKRASPFARSLVFAYVAAYLYDGDAPISERRAQALSLDRGLLAELLGQDELKDLIDPRAVDEVRMEVGLLEDDRRVTHEDALHDMLRRLGDLTYEEALARVDTASGADARAFIDALVQRRRAVRVRIAGEERIVAVEDVARYRDALGTHIPSGIPDAFLASTPSGGAGVSAREGALEGLIARYARTHGPFLVDDVALRFGLLPAQAEPALALLASKGTIVATTPGEYCDAEVLRRMKRKTLAKLRAEVSPVDGAAFARFLSAWHGLGSSRRGSGRLEEAIVQIEGVPLPWSILENEVLPARVPGFDPILLDELGATGLLVWVGAGPLGKDDGRIRLYRRERVPLLLDAPTVEPEAEAAPEGMPPLESAHRRVLAHLETRGASFASELLKASELPSTKELMDVLWDLVWRGLVTNDTFQPLRGLRARSSARRPRHVAMLGGRWSTVASLIGAAASQPSPTERLAARAMALLERCGVVSREATEGEPGGFALVYPVLRALEESGRVRRGHFVEGLSGAQFALPGAVERLRSSRSAPPVEQASAPAPASVDDAVQILSAVDPALPWGALLDWPETAPGMQPKRVAGARVVLVGGRPVFYVERGDKSILTFPAAREEGPDLERAVRALLEKQDYKSLRVARVDGEEAGVSARADELIRAGFVREHPGLVLTRIH
jgi:ATP-dependent Lhr-like helicase